MRGKREAFDWFFFGLCFFFCEIIEISFLQLIKNLTYVAFGGCSNFTVRGGSARRAVRRYKFNDIFFAFDTSRYTYTTLLFILQRRSFLPLLLFYLEFLYFLLLLLLFAQPTLDVVSIESDIFFKLGRGG